MPVTLAVNVRNEAPADRTLLVAGLGVDPSWLGDPIRVGPVGPGETVTAELLITPARGTLPAQYPMVVSAQALDPTSGLATSPSPGLAEVLVAVTPRSQLSLELVPAEISLVGTKRFAVEIRNNADVSSDVHLSTRPSHNLRMTLAESVTVPPRSTRRVTGRVRVRPRLFGWIGHHQFTVSAVGSDAMKHVEGTVLQRPVLPPFLAKALVVLTALSIWVATAMVMLPQFGTWVRTATERTERVASPEAATPSGPQQSDGAATDGQGGASSDGASGSGGAGGSGGSGGANATPTSHTSGVQLSGSVATDDPTGVEVRLEPTSLIDEETQGGVGIGLDDSALAASGLRLSSAMTRQSARRAPPIRTLTTTLDGSYSFAGVPAPGYYLLTFSKPGFQTRKYVIDSATEAAAQPLEVPLSPGEGRLSGRIRSPKGAVGGATITISDGTNTVTTSSNSRGSTGSWAIEGLSTPSHYVVSASSHGMSSEARLVSLGAGGSATADLTLVNGVTTLTGEVTRTTADGKNRGLGAATVTVTDGAGEVRTASTLTEGRVGWYTLPALTAPGRYSVTISSDGFAAQTTRLSIRRGQTTARVSVRLNPSTGGLSGRVLGPTGTGLEDSGLTLSNAENTYKTTSTSSPLGGYSLNGIEPGGYTLVTERFGMVTDRVSVKIRAGRVVDLDRRLSALADGVIPATAKVLGSVTGPGGAPLQACANGASDPTECVRATIVDETPEAGQGTVATTWTTRVRPREQYTLPAEPGKGLRPGVHTVLINAPGYEPATVRAQVGVGETVTAPTAEMVPVPTLQGNVEDSLARQTPLTEKVCVWVVPGERPTSTPSFPDCAEAITAGVEDDAAVPTADKCFPGSVLFNGVDENPARACAATTRSYSIQVARAGIYTLYVVPTDPLYAPSDHTSAAQVQVNRASTINRNLIVQRYGVANLIVRVPDNDHALVPSADTTISVDLPRTISDPLVTDADGKVAVRGLRPVAHTFSAIDSANEQQMGSRTVTVDLDEIRTFHLDLVDPVPSMLGQVRTNVFETGAPLPSASVELDVATGYGPPETNPMVIRSTLRLESNTQGCFAVRKPTTGTSLDGPGTCGTLSGAALLEATVVSDIAREARITAPGYEPLTVARTRFAGLVPFTLTPARRTFSPGTEVTLSDVPTSPPDWSRARVEVISAPPTVGTVEVGLKPGTDNGRAELDWKETSQTPNTILPGRYEVRVAVEGHTTEQATIVCRPAPLEACGFESPVTLTRQGQVELSLVSDAPAGSPIHDAGVTQLLNSGDIPLTRSGTSNTWLLANTDPGTGLRLRVRGAGHAFAHVGENGTTPVTCTIGSETVDTAAGIPVRSGLTTSCTATLRRLGSISGVAVGVPDTRTGGTDEVLTDTLLTAHRCAEVPVGEPQCTQLLADQFTTNRTTTGGLFTLAGSTTFEGLAAGSWLITLKHDDYDNPSRGQAPPGIVARVAAPGEQLTNVRLEFPVKGVTVNVRLVNAAQQTLPDDAVVTLGDEAEPDQFPATEVGSGSNRRHRFDNVPPGRWTIFARGAWFEQSYSVEVEAPPAGDRVMDWDFSVSRSTGSVKVSLTDVTGAPLRLKNARVSLECSGTEDQPTLCPNPGDAGAVSADGTRLVATTAGTVDGSVSLGSLPYGTYRAVLFAPGYVGTMESADFVIGNSADDPSATLAATTSFALTPVEHPVSFTVVARDPDQPLGAPNPGDTRDVVLTRMPAGVAGLPVDLGPGSATTLGGELSASVTPGDWSLQIPSVPAGCWRVAYTLPQGQRGVVDTPVQSGLAAADRDALGCPAGTLTVPLRPDSGSPSVRIDVNSHRLTFNPTVTPLAGGVTPELGIRVVQTGGGLDRDVPATSPRELWVAPGSYTVTYTALDRTAAFWTSTPVQFTLPADQMPVGGELVEGTKPVTISFAGLVTGDQPVLTLTRRDGLQLPGAVQSTKPDGSIVLSLPEGPWRITADGWSGGPDGTDLDVSDTTPLALTFGETP